MNRFSEFTATNLRKCLPDTADDTREYQLWNILHRIQNRFIAVAGQICEDYFGNKKAENGLLEAWECLCFELCKFDSVKALISADAKMLKKTGGYRRKGKRAGIESEFLSSVHMQNSSDFFEHYIERRTGDGY